MSVVVEWGVLWNALATVALIAVFVRGVCVRVSREREAWWMVPFLLILIVLFAADVPGAWRAIAEAQPDDVMPAVKTLVAAVLVVGLARRERRRRS